jgi:orotate phosphoribosyltransferase
MMVFARRDSGQFPLMSQLIAQHPFYYTTDLDMPQWEPAQCPLCRMNKPLLSWRDMPEL